MCCCVVLCVATCELQDLVFLFVCRVQVAGYCVVVFVMCVRRYDIVLLCLLLEFCWLVLLLLLCRLLCLYVNVFNVVE